MLRFNEEWTGMQNCDQTKGFDLTLVGPGGETQPGLSGFFLASLCSVPSSWVWGGTLSGMAAIKQGRSETSNMASSYPDKTEHDNNIFSLYGWLWEKGLLIPKTCFGEKNSSFHGLSQRE